MSKIKYCSNPVLCKIISCILCINMILYSVGCKNYYMLENVPKNDISEIESLLDPLKPVVVHWYNSIYDLDEAKVDSGYISGVISSSDNTFDPRFNTYTWDKVYKKADRDNINAVHIYLLYSKPEPKPGFIKIDFKYIRRIDYVKKDAGKTTKSHILGWAGISFFAAIIVAGIVNPPVSIGTFPSIGF